MLYLNVWGQICLLVADQVHVEDESQTPKSEQSEFITSPRPAGDFSLSIGNAEPVFTI